ncbi:MAG: type II toxin-antitoxin system RelE/ParE family toxin [Methyloligellaceae bacterium]
MTDYKLSARADNDFDHILQYTYDTFGPFQAVKYAEGLEKCFEIIASNPYIGPENELYPKFRSFPHGKHIIYYEIEADNILIVHIVHASMHPNNHF